MRMTNDLPIELPASRQPRIVGCTFGPHLSAFFILAMITSVAYPAHAQSWSATGPRMTDVRFADRLHANVDWLVGLEFPLFDDSITCPFEVQPVVAVPEPQSAAPEFDLELEIVRSVSEIFHVDVCEATALLWNPTIMDHRQLDSRLAAAKTVDTDVVDTDLADEGPVSPRIDRSSPWAFFLTPPKFPEFGWPQQDIQAFVVPEKRVPSIRFWEVVGSKLKWMGGEVEQKAANLLSWAGELKVGEFWLVAVRQNWLTEQVVRRADDGIQAWERLIESAKQRSLQPLPTASYVGLERAIYQVQDLVSAHFRRWQAGSELVAIGAARLVQLQNETYERVVLKQFDAIMR